MTPQERSHWAAGGPPRAVLMSVAATSDGVHILPPEAVVDILRFKSNEAASAAQTQS